MGPVTTPAHNEKNTIAGADLSNGIGGFIGEGALVVGLAGAVGAEETQVAV